MIAEDKNSSKNSNYKTIDQQSNDQPISNKNQDLLGRAKFSIDLAKGIRKLKIDRASFVIAIYGKWGSGKTSIINIVKEELEKPEELQSENKEKFIDKILLTKKFYDYFPISVFLILNIIAIFGWYFKEFFLERIIDFLDDHFLKFIFLIYWLLISILFLCINKIFIRVLDYYFDGKIFPSKFNKLTNWFKKSFINKLKKWFKKSFIKKPKNNIKIIEPNPWMFANLNNLTINFLREFGKQLNWKDNSTINRKLSDLLDVYGSILSPLNINSSSILKMLKLNHHKKSAQEIKEEIKKIIKKSEQKILVIIDDIDRLNDEETLELFRLIRINADFPNTIYLLSFDKDIVEKKLQHKFQDNNYLEKIVQLPFNIPQVKENRIHDYLHAEITNIFKEYQSYENLNELLGENYQYFQEIFDSGFKDLFKNLREVKRFVNTFQFSIQLIVNNNHFDANPVDLMAIEAIRYFADDFYEFIKNHKDRFANRIPYYAGKKIEKDEEEFKLKLNNNFININEEYRDKIKNLSIKLFPNIDFYLKLNLMHYKTINDLSNKKGEYLSICYNQYFDLYFNLNPDDLELTESEFSSILKLINSNDEKEFEQSILKYYKNDKIALIINKIKQHVKKINPEKVEKILIVFINLQDFQSHFFNIVYSLLNLNGDQKNFEIYQNIINKINDISKLTMIIRSAKENKSYNNPEIINWEELNNFLLNKIINQKQSLINQKNLLEILDYWHKYNSVKCQEFIDSTLKEDGSLLKFLKESIQVKVKFKSSISDSATMESFYFGGEDFQKFNIDPLQIKNRIEAIKKDNPELYQQHQETCNIFMKSLEDFKNI